MVVQPSPAMPTLGEYPRTGVWTHIIVVLSVLGGFVWLFSDVLFHDRNFTYRDAAQFYYPTFQVVRDQWAAGGWALWNPQENSGTPLLANPAASVLYPVRIVLFQWLPLSYAAAFKWYTLAHVLLAAGTAYGMARHWRVSVLGAGAGAISYAFGAIVLFQYCNVIFLVSAAWVPLALVAIDRSLRCGSWTWAVVLGVVLALQVLGGDPECAYVSGLLAVLYVAVLDPPWLVGFLAALAGLAGVRGRGELATLLLGTAAAVAARMAGRHVSGDRVERRRRTLQLALVALVAGGLSAVQVLPAAEFGRLSLRATPFGLHDPYTYQLAPWRVPELWWPAVFGRTMPEDTRWVTVPEQQASQLARRALTAVMARMPQWRERDPLLALDTVQFEFEDRAWQPSLYAGALPCLLAVTTWRLRGAAAWQRWLSLIVLAGVWAAVGRWGGLYWAMVHALPGFGTFRYPAKLLTFTAAGLAGLAAVGWDRWLATGDRRTMRLVVGAAATSGVLFGLGWVGRSALVEWWRESPLAQQGGQFGPLLPETAWQHLATALGHTAVLLVLGALLGSRAARPRARLVWQAALLGTVAWDLAAANHWLVRSDEQSQIDAEPLVLGLLREAEAREQTHGRDPVGAPIRIHRGGSSLDRPRHWFGTHAPDRDQTVSRWERNTLHPKYGQAFGVGYVFHPGTLESYDYWWFFAPFRANVSPRVESMLYYPRRGLDLWGAKYLVLPRTPTDPGLDSPVFLAHSRRIAESPETADDYQVLRNDRFYPRAWIVHRVLHRPPIRNDEDRDRLTKEMLYQGRDAFWSEPSLEGRVQDLRRVATVEHADAATVTAWQTPDAHGMADECRIVDYRPARIEFEIAAGARGLLVVAEPYFPGWQATVDGRTTPIWRTNRMMRGIPVEAGRHRVVLSYAPRPFRIGAAISGATAVLLVVAAACAVVRWRGDSRSALPRRPAT